jgi:small subunit ribosomal protein S6
MSNRAYESAVLINAALEDDQIDTILKKIEESITTQGGSIREIENWGRKRLAYMVKKSKIGYYTIYRYDAPPELISKLDRQFQLEENILRYLNIKLSNEALEQIEKDKKEATEVVEIEEKVASSVNSDKDTAEDEKDNNK